MTSDRTPETSTGRPADRVESTQSILPDQTVASGQSAPEGSGLQRARRSIPPERRRLSEPRLTRITQQLSDRDLQVIQLVSDHSFLTGRQLFQLLFHDHTTPASGERTARRVLKRLVELRALEHLQRRIGGIRAGSASYVFRVGLVGDQLLRQRSGQTGRARRKEPSLRHLDHALAVADTRVTLTLARRSGLFELLAVETEPQCWRRFPTLAGTDEVLKPDLTAVTASGDYEDHWFLEIDRGTESLPTVVAKCRPYLSYRSTGLEQDRYGVFPRVVWVVPDGGRADRVRQALAALNRAEGDLFRVCTIPELPAVVERGAA